MNDDPHDEYLPFGQNRHVNDKEDEEEIRAMMRMIAFIFSVAVISIIVALTYIFS